MVDQMMQATWCKAGKAYRGVVELALREEPPSCVYRLYKDWQRLMELEACKTE